MIPTNIQAAIDACEFTLGSDECGLGSWAGPLCVCAAVTPRDWKYPGVMDSKQLTRAAREKVYPKLIEEVTFYYVQIEPQEIDSLGVGAALRQGHMLATLAAIRSHQEKGHTDTPCCIVDGTKPVPMPPGYPVILTLPKADALIPAVSAASIIAKVRHDWEMDELDRKYPGYSLSKGAGYGTAAHQEGLKKLGCSPAHRMSYAPMKDMLKNAESDIFAGMEE